MQPGTVNPPIMRSSEQSSEGAEMFTFGQLVQNHCTTEQSCGGGKSVALLPQLVGQLPGIVDVVQRFEHDA